METTVSQHDCEKDGHCDHLSHKNQYFYGRNIEVHIYICCFCGRTREVEVPMDMGTKTWSEDSSKHGNYYPRPIPRFITP